MLSRAERWLLDLQEQYAAADKVKRAEIRKTYRELHAEWMKSRQPAATT